MQRECVRDQREALNVAGRAAHREGAILTRAPAPTRWAASAATPGRRAPSTADQRPLGTISTSSAAFSPSVTMCSKCERAVTSWFAMASGGGWAVCLPSGPYDLGHEERSGRVSS